MKKFYVDAYDTNGNMLSSITEGTGVWYADCYKQTQVYKTLVRKGMYKNIGYFEIKDAITRKVVEVIYKAKRREDEQS